MNHIDEYISKYPQDIQEILKKVRKTIQETAPEATEKISYGMPTFYLNKNLVHFAANKKHIGFYPSPSGIEKFKEKLINYKTSKGAIQFQYTEPIPYKLIKEIVKFRVQENKKE
ncbi:MAG: iron chaperone [Methanobacteriaceae archaeon]